MADLRWDVLFLGSLTKTNWFLSEACLPLDPTQKRVDAIFYMNFSVICGSGIYNSL